MDIGGNCFNPFQPEVMDVHELISKYRERPVFYAGIFILKALPYGTHEAVSQKSEKLLRAGLKESYIFSLLHNIERETAVKIWSTSLKSLKLKFPVNNRSIYFRINTEYQLI